MTSLRSVILLAAGALAAHGCGADADPFCGDGEVNPELGEECDDDTEFCQMCQTNLPNETTIKWAFNNEAVPGFPGDGCLDMGVVNVEVELSGPTTASETGSCSLRQVVFNGLPAGSYTATLRPVDIDGELKTSQPITETVELTGGDDEIETLVPWDAWAGAYTGTLYFRVTWDGVDCGEADVSKQRLTLTQGDQPVMLKTQGGQDLDGSSEGDCVSIAEPFPHTATGVPFGPATFTIEGYKNPGQKTHETTIETFIGAGQDNPEYTFDVPAISAK